MAVASAETHATGPTPSLAQVRELAREHNLIPLHQTFIDAGFEWREPGCSMCLGMNPDILQPGERCASTSNRNFEGRVNPLVRSNYLASPPLVVAYAIAGRVDIDITKESLGKDAEGKKVYLRDIWPRACGNPCTRQALRLCDGQPPSVQRESRSSADRLILRP